jgi:hypothetical protein
MWKFILPLFLILASPTLSNIYASTVTSYRHVTTTNSTRNNMADEWSPIRIRGRGRGNPARGNRGRGGRQAPVIAGRGFPIGGSPIATRLSVQQVVPDTDNNLDTFLAVRNNNTSHSITVDLAHVKKVEVASKPRVLAPRPWRSNNFTHDIHRRRLTRASTLLLDTLPTQHAYIKTKNHGKKNSQQIDNKLQ